MSEVGGPVDGVVGRGTLLAGRYRMFQPIASDLTGATAWAGNDQILDRPVRIAILYEGRVAQALDAARRAALVTDPRLVRVLDVGAHGGVSYMVTEPVTAPSLAQLVARGPLPADQARAIIGEAAAALEIARRRGVHHLALRPSVLHLGADNQVLLTGLAVDGALLGQGLGDARSTTRADTVGLVALLYAALTGRWPGAQLGADDTNGPHVPRLPAAPVISGVPVAPTELVAGVPNDLDTLCAVTLGSHDDGPHSPAELVLELEPWGNIQSAELLAATTRATSTTPTAPSRPPAPRTAGGGGAGSRPTDDQPTVTLANLPDEEEPPAEGAGAKGASEGSAASSSVRRTSVRSMLAGKPAAAVGRPGTPPPATPARTSAFGPTASSLPAPPPPAGTARPAPRPAPARPTTQARPTPARPAQANRAGTPASASPASQPSALAAPESRTRALEEFGTVREVLVTRRFDPTGLVLAVVLVAVIAGLFLAFQALTRPTSSAGPPAAASAPATPTDAASPPAEAGAPPAEPEAPPAAAAPPAIASATMIDPPPEGDDNEHPEAVQLAIDGDPATQWFTRTYRTPEFAGLKSGVGYGLTLSAPATVSTVTLQVNGTGGRVEVRSTAPATPTEGPVLAEGALGPDTVLTLSAPTQTQSLVLWFTALPQAADGSNRLELAEVSVS